MAFFIYASFPNSRQRNRAPTRQAVTYQVEIDVLGTPLTKVASENANRTYILLKNINDSYDFWYVYAGEISYSPQVVNTFGVKNQLLYNTTTNTLYQKQNDGQGSDWLPVLIQDVGERVEPYQTASLESLENIWCAANTDEVIAPATNVIVDIDEGRG